MTIDQVTWQGIMNGLYTAILEHNRAIEITQHFDTTEAKMVDYTADEIAATQAKFKADVETQITALRTLLK